MAGHDAKLKGVLQKINEQMYERNVELIVKNKTLSVLRDLYEIINTTLGVQETAERLAHVITKQMKFKGGSIVMYNEKSHTLDVIATSSSRSHFRKGSVPVVEALNSLKLSPHLKRNTVVDAYLTGKKQVTPHLSDLVRPYIKMAKSDVWQKQLQIETFVLYPIRFGGKVRGVLVLCMDKSVSDLSRAEKDTLHEVIDVVGIALEQARTYVDLKEANKKLKELDKMKDDFVSVASHELRTPMTAIKSYLWMALAGKGGKLSEKQEYYLKRSYYSTDRLIKLVNDMLNISRIDSGRITVIFDKVDILQLAKEVIEEVKPHADELKLSLILKDALAKKDRMVIADKEKIKEVLINLIGNSLKFTPEKGTITLHFEKRDNEIFTHVTDTGRGIDVKDLSTLFTKFGMIEGSYATNKKASGTGLGLYISKSIIDLHQGTISVASEGIGKGSTFSVSLLKYSAEAFKKMAKKSHQGTVDIIHTPLTS